LNVLQPHHKNGEKPMKNKMSILIAGLLVALLVVGLIGATNAFAQGSYSLMQHGRGPGDPGGHGLGQAELEAAAKALGMTVDELSTALQSGKTLEALATEKGVDFQAVLNAIQAVRPLRLGSVELEAAAKALNMTTDELTAAMQAGKTLEQVATDQGVDVADVKAAIQAAHATELRDRISQAVTDGTITQENADWLLEGLDKGFIGVPGAFGFGFGGHHGPGDGFGPNQPPATQPSTQPPQSSGS
jgi:hypothetical protein